MTASAASAPGAPSPRRSTALFAAAAVLIAVVATLVLLFGVTRPPALPSIAEAGVTPPGAVAGVLWSSGESCTALVVIRPDGTRHQVTCRSALGEVLGWPAIGIATTTWDGPDPGIDYLDPESGAVVRHDTSQEGASPVYEGGVVNEWRDGTLVVRANDSGVALWTVGASSRYSVNAASLSPDGRWYALIDSFDRLLIVPSDGSSAPAVWATGRHDGRVARPGVGGQSGSVAAAQGRMNRHSPRVA